MDQKNTPLEQRSYHFEVRAEESEAGNIITGRPIVYNSRTDLGWFDEIIEPGALNNTDLTDVRFLVNHDTSKIPLARSRRNNGNSTMQLTTDNDGLGIRVTLDTENNSEARQGHCTVPYSVAIFPECHLCSASGTKSGRTLTATTRHIISEISAQSSK